MFRSQLTNLAVGIWIAVAVAAPYESSAWATATITSVQSFHSSHSISPTAAPTTAPTTPIANDACATVSSLVSNLTDSSEIPAQIGWDCLQSVPLNVEDAIPWIKSLKPYLQWQSTLSYLKNPPKGYLLPAHDVIGSLDSIIDNIHSYPNQYALEYDVFRAIQLAYDGHLSYIPNLVGWIMEFGRPISLVSVSTDGKALPKPYVYTDLLIEANTTGFKPSAITQIDGQDVVSYLEELSLLGISQDPDALYNSVFFEPAQASVPGSGILSGTFAGYGNGALFYPNATTVLTFENGTTSSYENFARVFQNFTGVNTGQDVYSKYVLGPVPTTLSSLVELTTSTTSSTKPTITSSVGTISSNITRTASATSTAPINTSTRMPGYPTPVIRQNPAYIGGYYINQSGYEDVAVLSVPSFLTSPQPSIQQGFQQVAFQFINQAKAAGKTRLLIDLSANGGGTIFQGYNLFTNLFPDLVPYGATRFRAHESFNIIGETVSALAGPIYPWNYSHPPISTVFDLFAASPFDYRADDDINNQPFPSWQAKYGPHTFNNDNFTSIIRWNLSDPLNALAIGINITGYDNRTNLVPSRPFAAENITLLTDGYCASTCTIFAELMTQQAGVKTITIGGRPRPGKMQALGGVKGANDFSWQIIWAYTQLTYNLGTPEQQAAWNQTELASYSLLPLTRAFGQTGSVNVRDGLRMNDTSQTPLQFVYEAADCRLYYTPEMMLDITEMWKSAADVAWGGEVCVDRQRLSQSGKTKMKTRSSRSSNSSGSGRKLSNEWLQDLYDSLKGRSGRRIALGRSAYEHDL